MLGSKSTSIEVERLFLFLAAIYNELYKILIEIVSKLAVEDNQAGNLSKPFNPNIALRTILSTDLPVLRAIKSTSTSFNREMLFVTVYRKQLHNFLEISKMDCSLLLDILLNFPNFFKNNDKANHKCPHKTRNCCEKCNHSDTNCKKNDCSVKCNHAFQKCNRKKDFCQKYAKLCCGNCQACLQCNMTQFQRYVQAVPTATICPSFAYYYCWEILLDLRNTYAHSNETRYQNFLDGITPIKIIDFSFYDEQSLKTFLHDVFSFIGKDITDPVQRKYPFKPDECEAIKLRTKALFEKDTSLTLYVFHHMELIRERTKALNETN